MELNTKTGNGKQRSLVGTGKRLGSSSLADAGRVMELHMFR